MRNNVKFAADASPVAREMTPVPASAATGRSSAGGGSSPVVHPAAIQIDLDYPIQYIQVHVGRSRVKGTLDICRDFQ